MSEFKPTRGKIFVTGIEQGMQKTKGGIILNDDNFKDHGIRPRWCQVYAIGEGVEDITVGEWILVEHGRWTLRLSLELDSGPVDVWMVDPKAMLLASTNNPANERFEFK